MVYDLQTHILDKKMYCKKSWRMDSGHPQAKHKCFSSDIALPLKTNLNYDLCISSQFLALTEDDLNKYDLTQGAKKKLKTQLELQKWVWFMFTIWRVFLAVNQNFESLWKASKLALKFSGIVKVCKMSDRSLGLNGKCSTGTLQIASFR